MSLGTAPHGLQASLVAGIPAVHGSQGWRQESSVTWGPEHTQPEAQGELLPPLPQRCHAQLGECRLIARIVRPKHDAKHTLLDSLQLVMLPLG